MKARIALVLKIAWLIAALMILAMGLNLCVATEGACFEPARTMILLMLLISFPLGLPLFLIAIPFLSPEGPDPFQYFTVWLILTCGGYFQWFVLAPRLFGKPNLVTLDLNRRETPITEPATISQPQSKRQVKRTKPVSFYDKQGRTRLERILARRS